MQELPEVIISGHLPKKTQETLLKKGIIKKLISRAYTSNLTDDPASIIKKNWSFLTSTLFPGAVLSHRSAIEFSPSPQNNIYLTYNSRKVIKWPGLNVRMIKGHERLEDDFPLTGKLYVSSLERACLENLSRTRTMDGEKRTLDQSVIEDRLIQELNTRGEEGLNKLRDRARSISSDLDMIQEFEKLNKIISSILSTHPSDILTSPVAMATSIGEPYDAGRIQLFVKLIGALRHSSFEDRPDPHEDRQSFQNFAFYEAYFSNFIEGTTFEIQEAEDIIYKQLELPNRTGDTHDIRSTYGICADQKQMSTIPKDGKELIDLLRQRHSVILKGRPEKQPGYFKIRPNRAGDTRFVDPKHVIGTLKHGHELIHSLRQPLSRAIYMMFLVSEVHPFDDGNGRIARIMMNAELVNLNENKILIPTVYRDDYILNLRKLTRQGDTTGFIRMMDRIHAYSSSLEKEDFQSMKNQLLTSNAFKESNEAAIILNHHSNSSLPS